MLNGRRDTARAIATELGVDPRHVGYNLKRLLDLDFDNQYSRLIFPDSLIAKEP